VSIKVENIDISHLYVDAIDTFKANLRTHSSKLD